MKNEKMTIKDIADACGVTIATVSRAINNQEGMRESVRKHILRYIESIGWRSNTLKGRFAVSKNAGKTVFILCNIWSLNGGGTNSLEKTMSILIEQLEKEDIIPMVIYGKTLAMMEQCLELKPYGIILLAGHSMLHDPIRKLIQAGIRVISAYADNLESVCPYIKSDYDSAARLAVERLQDTGCRKIGIFAGLGMLPHPKRQKDIQRYWFGNIIHAVSQLQRDFDYQRDVTGDCFGQSTELIRMLKDKENDGWICCGHTLAQHFCYEAELLGIKVPQKLPVIFFGSEQNRFDPLSRLGHFTSRSQEMADLLYRLIISESIPENREYKLTYQWHEGTIPLKKKRKNRRTKQKE